MLTPLPTPISDVRTQAKTTSARIRSRLQAAGQRFHANDNISDFIEEGEMEALHTEVQDHVEQLLKSLVIDIEQDHNTMDTARRVAGMFLTEVFRGRYEPAPTVTTFPNITESSGMMVVGPIDVRSACSHHLCPILGKVWVGIVPNASCDLIGLSKYARLCDWIMSRPQIQEEAVVMLADELERRIHPDGLAIVMQASHFCMSWRGVKDGHALMNSSVMRGAFASDAALRGEFWSLLNNGKGPSDAKRTTTI